MKNTLSILSFDPGQNLGWAKSLVTLESDKLAMKVTDHGTVDLTQLSKLRMRNQPNDIYTLHRVRMMIFEETIRKLSTMVKFDIFVVEDIFFRQFRVSSFRALALYIEALENIINSEHKKILYCVSPTLVKKHIANYGMADKLQVQEALLASDEITLKSYENLNEHSADAISVAYAFAKQLSSCG